VIDGDAESATELSSVLLGKLGITPVVHNLQDMLYIGMVIN
jgi:hypothetical protein